MFTLYYHTRSDQRLNPLAGQQTRMSKKVLAPGGLRTR